MRAALVYLISLMGLVSPLSFADKFDVYSVQKQNATSPPTNFFPTCDGGDLSQCLGTYEEASDIHEICSRLNFIVNTVDYGAGSTPSDFPLTSATVTCNNPTDGQTHKVKLSFTYLQGEVCPAPDEEEENGKCVKQCPAGETVDPVTNECIPQDGGTTEEPACTDLVGCMDLAIQQCDSINQDLINFLWLGYDQYGVDCGHLTKECPVGEAWNVPSQVCMADTDGDGTNDPYDPDPDDATNNGDSDGDGISDAQDEFPDDPTQWNDHTNNNFGNIPTSVGYGSVAAVGESDKFNDSAIVEAINQNTNATNTTNQFLEHNTKLNQTTNSLLGDLSDAFDNAFADGADPEMPDTDSILDSAFNAAGIELDKSITDLGGREYTQSDAGYLDTMVGQLPTAECINPTVGPAELDFCSKASLINGALYWIVAVLTLIAIFDDMNASLRRS